MKRTHEALVASGTAVAVAAALAAALAVAAPAVHAASPIAKLKGEASLTRVSADGSVAAAASFHVTTSFSADTPGAEPWTIQRAVIYFPDHAGTNGRLFPSCGAAQIERFRGDVRRCPKGSRVGDGSVTAKALQLGVTANGRVTMFNSHRGRAITFNIQTLLPAYINQSLDARLTQLHGRYGEKLTLVVPRSLQEIISGVFVGVERFDVTIGGAVRVHGAQQSFLKARTCPRQPMHGVFEFVDGTSGQTATTTADAKVRCSVRRPGAHRG